MNVLDIHTHRRLPSTPGTAIINYTDAGFFMDVSSFRKGEFYSVGLHPWDLTKKDIADQFIWLNHWLESDQVVALGEAGLDKFASASMNLQMTVFEKEIELSEQRQLPLIIHCVRAVDELLFLKKKYNPVQPWIWHGFRGKIELMNQLLRHGFYFSFGEFYHEEAMAAVPGERLFLETDEGEKTMEELLVRAADIRSVTTQQLQRTIQENIQNVFFTK